jgi:hypothetical protein
MSSIKTPNSKFNLINERVKYGTDGGINIDSGTLVVNPVTMRAGINTLNPTYTFDVSGSSKTTSITDYSNSTGNNSQILTKVNGQNLWSYDDYYLNGNNMFQQNIVNNLPGILPIRNQAWYGAVLHPNGKIYTTPYQRSSTIVIDTYTNTWSEINIPIISGELYRGGVVAPNGKIYYPPFISDNILVNDVINNRFYKIPAPSSAYSKYAGCVLAPNGKIYAIPCDSNNVMIINPENDSYTNIYDTDLSSTVFTQSLKWSGGVLATNGKIYCAPAYATSVLVIDPFTDTFQYNITGINGYPAGTGYSFNSFKWSGGALGINGKIYFVPYGFPYSGSSLSVLEIDTSNNTGVLVGPSYSSGVTRKYVGATLAPNGIIYSFAELPNSGLGVNVLQINTNSSTATFTNTIQLNQRTWGSCLGPNNTIYTVPIPVDTYYIQSIKTGLPTLEPWMIAPEFNKF